MSVWIRWLILWAALWSPFPVTNAIAMPLNKVSQTQVGVR